MNDVGCHSEEIVKWVREYKQIWQVPALHAFVFIQLLKSHFYSGISQKRERHYFGRRMHKLINLAKPCCYEIPCCIP